MCGIAGAIRWGGAAAADEISDMVSRLRHRGPDASGTWTSPDGRCVLGHARLSILDLSDAGNQPMTDAEAGNTIVFNGEIYNFRELRKLCEARGDRFRSTSDTEVLLALYRWRGVEMLQWLRGMFAFAIWDPACRQLFLARDRVGKKPLNYALTPGGLVFASEIDPLARHPEVDRRIDVDALELYLQLQYIPAPWTIYRGIRKLPAAHYAVVTDGGFRAERYWDVDYRSKRGLSEADAIAELDGRLMEAVRLRMVADVPVGALLSGGVDSSLVVAMMARQSAAPVKTFTIGFEEESYSELPYAKTVADLCGTDHNPQVVKGDVQSILGTLARHYGEPYADSSAVPSFFVSRAAGAQVKVALNGDGGDELLGGYPRYTLRAMQVMLARQLGRRRSPAVLAARAAEFWRTKSLAERIERRWLLRFAHPELQSVAMYGGFWNDHARTELLGGRQSPVLHEWWTGWLRGAIDAADNPIDRMLWMDNRTYLAGDLLVKMDIASMHCGLETRSPLLDQELIEYCASLPHQLKVRNRVGKYLLKRVAERHLPRSILYRPKMGFGIPLSEWLRGPLRPVVESVLTDGDVMAPLAIPVISRTLDEFYRLGLPHASRIWALLMFGIWKRACVLNRERAGTRHSHAAEAVGGERVHG